MSSCDGQIGILPAIQVQGNRYQGKAGQRRSQHAQEEAVDVHRRLGSLSNDIEPCQSERTEDRKNQRGKPTEVGELGSGIERVIEQDPRDDFQVD